MHPDFLTPKKPAPKKKLLTIDREFEEEVNHLADAIIEEDKKEFQPGIESFEMHANRIRQEVSDAMHRFQATYVNGYEAICERLDAEGLDRPQVNPANLKVFEDPLAFMDALEKGQEIYELLGFSPDQIKQFYQAAYKLATQNEYAKARDSFYFLVTIASEIPAFWLGLGLCNAQIKEYEASKDAFLEAIRVDPTNPDAYLGCIHALIQLKAKDEALKVCENGLEANPTEQVKATLEEAKRYLNSQ